MFPRPFPYKPGMSQRSPSDQQPRAPQPDLLILGAGAAGLFCALTAARKAARAGSPRNITLVDAGRQAARKLRASGGGRCNCTNREAAPGNYLSRDPGFTKQALSRFRPADFLAFLAELDLSAHEEDQGRMFCDQGAQALADALERACRQAGCRFRLGCAVAGVTPPEEPGGCFRVELDAGGKQDSVLAPRLVLALGGPAWPALGGTDSVARLAGSLGLAHVPARPALTPFLLGGAEGALCRELSGLSVTARLTLPGGFAVTDGLLFTHQGLSGPAALRASSHWAKGQEIAMDLAPGADLPALFRARAKGGALARSVFFELLPRRLAEARLAALPPALAADIAARPLAELSRAQVDALAEVIRAWRVTPKATAGMARAEAASGGLDVAGFSPRSMECRALPGLFAIGEALDVAGDLGGFNLHWAWASAFAAGGAA